MIKVERKKKSKKIYYVCRDIFDTDYEVLEIFEKEKDAREYCKNNKDCWYFQER